ncbi:MAG TPA: alpha/beta hydrolase [Pseudonocardiaceae bacterium]|jgi:proline iminopeptidase|nr:alpha/beta hydrolase [Pseudonocardiaceae bacterium]
MIPADDGCSLWATSVGDGPSVLLCHGGPGLWDMFGDLAASLAPALRVIRWDQRGCGRSARRGPYSLARSVADLDAVRRHFGLATTAVLGHSWGADLALRYAIDHPDRVDRLCYVSGVGIGREWREPCRRNFTARLGADFARWAQLNERDRSPVEDRELAILQWTADFADRDLAAGYAERMATPWFDINFECNALMDDLTDEPELAARCRNLTVPTLILDGAQDIRPRRAVDSLAEALPSVTRVELPHVGHVPWLEGPDRVRDVLIDYLTSHRA